MEMNTIKFEYAYSSKQTKEIEDIRKKYITKEESKIEKLKRLDKEAEKPGTIVAIVFGVVGTLLLGIGMSCTMVWTDSLFGIGIIVGVIGIGVTFMAYPMYVRITKKQREKIADQILALTEELCH